MATVRSMWILCATAVLTSADMYDVIMPQYQTPAACADGCATWTSLPPATLALWANNSASVSASNHCAIPAASVDEPRNGTTQKESCGGPLLGDLVCNGTTSSFYGPICACSGVHPPQFATCSAPLSYPEQINLQIASSTVVVVSFVTFEEQLPASPPTVQLVASNGSTATLTGVAHLYTTSHAAHSQFCDESSPDSIHCLPRNYTMSFVKLSGLTPRQRYKYKVKSGGEHAQWSEMQTFRALYETGPTRIAVYGDMGATLHNNMANLKADCVESNTVDAIVHLGDHCYDLSMGNDLHGDAYMNAFQPVIAGCPWLPVIGNHESTSGAGGDRVDSSAEQHYLNQTWGVVMDSTAETGLGHLLTKGTAFAAGSHGHTPSRTSQWAAVDIGLIHFAVLDLDPGPPPMFAGDQAAWLEADLIKAVANRANVPWIVVGSHFPLYAGRLDEPGAEDASLVWYHSETSEGERGAKPWMELPSFTSCSKEEHSSGNCTTVGDSLRTSRSALEPLLDKYGVDLYLAGHIHSYSVSWPIKDGAVMKKSLVDPQGVVHVLEGQGGVPNQKSDSPSWINRLNNCSGSNFRICGTGGAYGRLLTSNASVLVYEHVENPTGVVSDRWAITRTKPNGTGSQRRD